MKPSRIRRLRRANGWTQSDLAGVLGTDAVTVSRWERGVSRPRPSAAGRLKQLEQGRGELEDLIEEIGITGSIRVLRRTALLVRKPRTAGFPFDASTRLKETERLNAEQRALKDALDA